MFAANAHTQRHSHSPLPDSDAAAGDSRLGLVHLLPIQSDEPWVDPECTTHTHKLNDDGTALCIVRDTSAFNSESSCLSHSHKCFGLNMFFLKSIYYIMLHVSLYYYTYVYHCSLKKHVRQSNNCSNLSVIKDETSHRHFYLTASFFHPKYP